MLLSELKQVLFGAAIEDQTVSNEAASLLASQADVLARDVARNLDQRESVVASVGTIKGENIWDRLERYWTCLQAGLDPSYASSRSNIDEDTLINLTTMTAKLERNLIAGLYEHQRGSIRHEPAVRRSIFHITSFARIEDPRFSGLQTMMTQLLSNMVSPTPDSPAEHSIADQQLDIYLSGRREDDVIIRLLDSRDSNTNLATLHLIHNIIRDNTPRQERLLSATGIQWLVTILVRMDEWLDSGDGRFELACSIFNAYIGSGLHPVLYQTINPPSSSSEPVTPAQTALLKLVDAHLSSHHANPPLSPDDFLLPAFERMQMYAVASLSSGLDDARLPKVLEGLVLVLEGLGSIGLACQGRSDRSEPGGGEEELVKRMKAPDTGMVGPVIALLKGLNDFLPRLRPSPANPVSDEAPTERSLGGIKVSLVRLLGVLTYHDTAVGDQVRECGGVHLVLSMTEVDERNPYLREHALFAVRNLMLNNPANQAVVKEMDPVGVVSDTGEVLSLPDKLRRQAKETNGGHATS